MFWVLRLGSTGSLLLIHNSHFNTSCWVDLKDKIRDVIFRADSPKMGLFGISNT